MKNRLAFYFGTAVSAGILMISAPASAQNESHHGPGLFASSFQTAHIAQRLDLSEEQRQQFREILSQTRPEADDLADAILANRRALRELQKGTEMSDSEIREIADRRGQLVSRMIVLKVRVRSQIDALLTPEQRSRFQEMQKQKMKHNKHQQYNQS